MSEAVLQSSLINHQSSDLDQARHKRLAATLIYLVRDFKNHQEKINLLEQKIDDVNDELETIVYKRKRLSSQNFSASAHLKPTHKKYWKKQQELLDIKDNYHNQLYQYRKTSSKTARKISDLRSKLLD